jgi:hypothetical protein
MQGYNAQAVTNERQIVIAAEINGDSSDFGHLEPMVSAAQHELEGAGVTQTPEVLVADAGYWHQAQMENVINQGIQVLIPPDAGTRGLAGTAAPTRSCAACLRPSSAMRSTENARCRSSPCSRTRSSTAGSIASNAAADRRAAQSGD